MVQHAQLHARHGSDGQPFERLPGLDQAQQVESAVQHADIVVRCNGQDLYGPRTMRCGSRIPGNPAAADQDSTAPRLARCAAFQR